MHKRAMEEEKWRLLEKAITKAKAILDGYAVNEVFNTAEYVTNYEYPLLLFLEQKSITIVNKIMALDYACIWNNLFMLGSVVDSYKKQRPS